MVKAQPRNTDPPDQQRTDIFVSSQERQHVWLQMEVSTPVSCKRATARAGRHRHQQQISLMHPPSGLFRDAFRSPPPLPICTPSVQSLRSTPPIRFRFRSHKRNAEEESVRASILIFVGGKICWVEPRTRPRESPSSRNSRKQLRSLPRDTPIVTPVVVPALLPQVLLEAPHSLAAIDAVSVS